MNLKAPTEDTLAIIMGGGAGTRLFPLTKERAKPAVPLAGEYRLVDIPIIVVPKGAVIPAGTSI